MRSREAEAAFVEIYSTKVAPLRRTAYLLCGDWHQAEDLVQVTFIKTFSAWPRVKDLRAIDGYLRQTLTRTFIDEARRHWRGEQPTEHLPDTATVTDSTEDRIVLAQALNRLGPQQRACLVLRYFEDLSIAETARVLGCTEGTVKSNTARGLDNIRDVLTTTFLTETSHD